jgi:3-hydroxyisobutyrate dehydrogenase
VGDLGAFKAMKPGATWLQMSTIGVEGTEHAIDLTTTRPDIAFVGAPVSGSRYIAEKGKAHRPRIG